MSIVNKSRTRRTYTSPLREQQAAETRDRILAGLAQTMSDGIAEVSVPAVAEAAGVSVATVYRHYPTKRALFEALPGYFARLVGMDRPSLPATQEEFEDMIRRLFVMYERLGEVARAAMDSQLGDVARQNQMPKRMADLSEAVAIIAPDLSSDAQGRVTRVLLVLTASGAQRMLKLAGQGPEAAAEDVIRAMRALVETERSSHEGSTRR